MGFVYDLTGGWTVPQILIDDVPIGGYAELWRLDRSGALDERLAAAGPATEQSAIEATQSRVMTAIEQGVGNGAMPAGILEGSNATTVANFVARVAGQ